MEVLICSTGETSQEREFENICEVVQAYYLSQATLQDKCMSVSTGSIGIRPVASASLADELVALMTCTFQGYAFKCQTLR